MVHLNITSDVVVLCGCQDFDLQLVLVIDKVWHVVMITAPGVRNFLGLRIIHELVVSDVMNIQNFVQFSLELWSHNMEFSCSLIDFVDEGKLV